MPMPLDSSVYSNPAYRQLFPNGPISGASQPDPAKTQQLVAAGVIPQGAQVNSGGYIVTNNADGTTNTVLTNADKTTAAQPSVGNLTDALGGNLARQSASVADDITHKVVYPSMAIMGGAGLISGLAGAGAVGAPGATGADTSTIGLAGTGAGTASGAGTLAASPLTMTGGGSLPLISGLPGGAAAASGGSLISRFTNPNALESFSKGLGAFGQAEANNRGAANDDTARYDQTRIAAQTARDADESQSLKHLSQTGYILGGGTPYHAPSPTINGHTYNLPDLGLGPAPITPEMKAGAGTLQSQLLDRLKPGGTVTPTPPQTTPGTGENLANYGSLIASGIGLGRSIFGK